MEDKKKIKELEEKEQWYYKDAHTTGRQNQRPYEIMQIGKGNIVADCIQLIKEHMDGHVLAPVNRLESIMEVLEIMGNYSGSGLMNTKDLAMQMARDISAMITNKGEPGDE